MPRFAILDHDWPVRHWDLLLEAGPTCLTWRLAAPPDRPGPIPAIAAAPHRLVYLDYKGPVSGDRGTVSQWDAGTYERLDPHAAHPEGTLRIVLHGRRMHGTAVLERTAVEDRWTFDWASHAAHGEGTDRGAG